MPVHAHVLAIHDSEVAALESVKAIARRASWIEWMRGTTWMVQWWM